MPGKPIGCPDCGDDAWGNWRLEGPSIARYSAARLKCTYGSTGASDPSVILNTR